MRISDWSSDVCSSDLADLAFHETILRGSRNQFLMHLVPLVANALRLSFDLSVTSMETARGALPLHRRVADAILAGNGAAARAALAHLIELADRKSTRLNSSH